MAGRLGSMRAPRPSSTSSNAGSTVVPPGATRPRISLTASTASRSASIESSSQAPASSASARHRTELVEEPAVVAADRLAGLARVGLEQLALLLAELGRHDDVDHHVEVATRPVRRRCGTPLSRSRISVPGWVPGLTSTGSSPSTVGTVIVAPERRLRDRDRAS